MANLILTGFMGTGKTTIGRMLAERLNHPFVDMDAAIEQRAGQSIPEIFATQGETGFRQLESEVCQELAAQDGLVIATGGGALVDVNNRDTMAANGVIICLTASPEQLIERMKDTDRPLLQVHDPAQRIRQLLQTRAAAYAALPHHVDTSHLTPEQVMEAILKLWHTQSR